jgi:hypothetical protein
MRQSKNYCSEYDMEVKERMERMEWMEARL